MLITGTERDFHRCNFQLQGMFACHRVCGELASRQLPHFDKESEAPTLAARDPCLLCSVLLCFRPPILVILDAQLLTLERRAALLWRADRAKVHVIMVVPTLSPDDIRIVMKSLTFVGEVIQCPPTQALYVSCVRHGEIEEAKLR
jgi:hypothetical protein